MITLQPNWKATTSAELPVTKPKQMDVEEVLRTLEKLYNDYLIRPDECKALDWAIRFIKAHTKTGLDKVVADCERHIVCKGCPHEKECE